MLKQAKGRVDRMNTPYTELHYYHLVSKSPIDMLISKALKGKKDFNAHAFAVKMGFKINDKNSDKKDDKKCVKKSQLI